VITAAGFYQGDGYSARIAGLVGSFEDGLGNDLDTHGITVSGSVDVFDRGQFTATFVTGEGIGNLLIGGGAQSVGGIENDADGFTLAYSHEVTDRLTLSAAYGRESYDLATVTNPGVDFTDLETLFLTAFYRPTPNLTLAGEYIHGERTDSAGATFDADRIGASITFSF